MPRRSRPALPYDERPMQTRASTPTDRAVPGDGIPLHVRDWGGGGRAVVLLHGLASNARIWDEVAPRLVGAGLRVVALDLRGHGDSGQPGEEVRRTMAPPRFAVPLDDWLARAKRFDPGGGPGGRPWIRDHLRNGVEVDDRGVARSRFRFENHLQVIEAMYDQWPPDLYPLVDCPVLLCPAGDPADPGPMAAAKRGAVARALELFPSASVTWFEDTMH